MPRRAMTTPKTSAEKPQAKHLKRSRKMEADGGGWACAKHFQARLLWLIPNASQTSDSRERALTSATALKKWTLGPALFVSTAEWQPCKQQRHVAQGLQDRQGFAVIGSTRPVSTDRGRRFEVTSSLS